MVGTVSIDMTICPKQKTKMGVQDVRPLGKIIPEGSGHPCVGGGYRSECNEPLWPTQDGMHYTYVASILAFLSSLFLQFSCVQDLCGKFHVLN